MADQPRACPSCRHPCVPEDKYCSECGFLLAHAAETNSDNLIGKTLPGGYRIVEFIAEGSMGRVYRAEQSTLGRSVAVKIMNQALLAHPKMVDRFRTEAKAASMLNHPNCMRVYDFGEMPDGPPYLVMELLQGKDLELVLQDEPLLPITRVLDLSLQILRALEEAHEQGIVHRDLKPANVFVLPQRGGGDLVKVVDFGLAKLKSAISGSTMTGLVCGTPAYMAPEQATASETDPRTDLYACGVMLFEMLAGRAPFIDDEPSDLLRKQVYDEPPRLSDINAERAIPGIELVLDSALAKKKEDRFQTATAFAEALQELVSVRTGERSHSWVRTSLRSCTECGGLFSSSARFCGECGAPVPRDSLPFPISVPVGVSSSIPAQAAESDRPAGGDPRERPTPAFGRMMGPDLGGFTDPEIRSKPVKREGLPREESPSAREARRGLDSRAEEESAPVSARARNVEARNVETRNVETAGSAATTAAPAGALTGRRKPADTRNAEPRPTASSAPKSDPRRDESSDQVEPVSKARKDPKPARHPSPDPTDSVRGRDERAHHTREEIKQREREEAWSAGSYDEPDETPAALMLIEARAASRLRVGDVKAAVVLLRRAIALVRSDVDRGDIDDPIGAMAMFTGKLGDALMSAGEHDEALATLSESLHLTSAGAERVRLMLQMSRAARALSRDNEANRYLEDAEREARGLERRKSARPGSDGEPRDSGITFNRDSSVGSRGSKDPGPKDVRAKKRSF